MKRGDPPVRRTPLTPGKPLANTGKTLARKATPRVARSALPKATRPLPQKSAKRIVEDRVRAVTLREMTGGEPQLCQRCQREWACDGHEVLSRGRGGSITDRNNIALLCRLCHTWVTDNPASAEVEGWALPSPPRTRVERAS